MTAPEAPPPDLPAPPRAAAAPPRRLPVRARLEAWIAAIHRDPAIEERSVAERKARLLAELNQAVSEAPDDMPIKDIIARLNHHHED